jgi:hypothetical protein
MARKAFMDKGGNLYIYSNTKIKDIKEIRYSNGVIYKITKRKVSCTTHIGKRLHFDKKLFSSYLNSLIQNHKNSNKIIYDSDIIVIS